MRAESLTRISIGLGATSGCNTVFFARVQERVFEVEQFDAPRLMVGGDYAVVFRFLTFLRVYVSVIRLDVLTPDLDHLGRRTTGSGPE